MKKTLSLLIVLSMLVSCILPLSVMAEDKPIFSESFEGMSGHNLPEGWTFLGKRGEDFCSYDFEKYTDGKVSAFVNDDDETASSGFVSPFIEAEANKVYTGATDIYVVKGGGKLYLKFFDAEKKQLMSKSKTVSKLGVWSEIYYTLTAPEGTKYMQIVACGTSDGINVSYYDNMRIYEGEVKAKKTEAAPPDASFIIKPTGDSDILYAQSFEGLSGFSALPEGWKYFGNKTKDMCTYTTEVALDGLTSAYIIDRSTEVTCGYTSPLIEIEAGKEYSATVNAYVIEGTGPMFFKFYDENQKQLSSKTITAKTKNKWESLSGNGVAPAGAKYVGVVLGGTTNGISVACYDNFKIHSGIVKYAPIKPVKPFDPPLQKDPVTSKLITPSGDKLVYSPYNEQGDTLTDFSYAGFYGGQYELPDTNNLPVAATIEPSADPNADDTARIQAVIDKVYSEATNDFMKVIKVKKGKYNINKDGIWLKSGIVLSGEGQDPDGTIFYATDKEQYVVINVKGLDPKILGDNANILDDYVKAGSNTITIEADKAPLYKVGDRIVIHHPSTAEWIKAMEMDAVKDAYNNNKNSWRKDTIDSTTERVITAIEGNKLTLDMPLYVPLLKEYSQSYIYKISDELLIKHVGIENLRVDSYYNGNFDDEEHAKTGVEFRNAKDCFVRNFTGRHLVYSSVYCTQNSKRITVLNCSFLDPVSQIAGGRRYSFGVVNKGQQVLMHNCYSYDARHDYATSRQVTGPIVYLDCVNDESNDASEPHASWSTGVLYDNIMGVGAGNDGLLSMANRGIYGTDLSQGWTVGGGISWNSLQTLIVSHKPPLTYQNFLIGAWGVYDDEESKIIKADNLKRVAGYHRTTYVGADTDKTPFAYTEDDTSMAGTAYMEATTAPVEPRSLYKAQLAERLTGSIKNARPNAPVIVNPRAEFTSKETTISFEGLYQKGATKVIIYIDNKPYEATLNPTENMFKLTVELEKGVHKIYATQIIDGVESVKCADRFLTVIESTGHKEYLSSDIDFEKTGLILNDPRVKFDAYQKELLNSTADKITVIVNEALLESDVDPFIKDGRTLVPMRAIFEALEANVSWDDATKTATATAEDIEVKITSESTTAYINGAPYTLDVPALIENGRFVVPVRFISESFGATVEWNGVRKIVTISGGKALYPAKHDIPGALDVYDVVQSGDDGSGNAHIKCTMDAVLKTYWGVAYDAENPMGAYGIFDLGKVRNITDVQIAFFKGDTRQYTIELYISEDGINYTKILDKTTSSGTTAELINYQAQGTGRYVKLVGYGNNTNQWNSISEVVIIGK